MYSKEQIVKDITNYMDNKGVQYWNEVYVGISKNPEDRLFNGHGVQKDQDPWIYRRAFSSRYLKSFACPRCGDIPFYQFGN